MIARLKSAVTWAGRWAWYLFDTGLWIPIAYALVCVPAVFVLVALYDGRPGPFHMGARGLDWEDCVSQCGAGGIAEYWRTEGVCRCVEAK